MRTAAPAVSAPVEMAHIRTRSAPRSCLPACRSGAADPTTPLHAATTRPAGDLEGVRQALRQGSLANGLIDLRNQNGHYVCRAKHLLHPRHWQTSR
jgi:hypothetical protein